MADLVVMADIVVTVDMVDMVDMADIMVVMADTAMVSGFQLGSRG
jgi:hypothetical protein